MQLSSNARKALATGLTISTFVWSAMLVVVPAVSSAAVHSDGCLVLSGGAVWKIENGTRRGFTSSEVFTSHGYNFSQVVTATSEDAALPVGPIIVYADGTLVKGPSDPLVYLVANGQKRGFVSGSVFTGLGFSFANIVQAPANTFNDLPMGANMDSATAMHTSGVLVNDNGTIFQMTATGKKGVPSMAVLNSWGLSLKKAVAANSADMAATNEGTLSERAACTSTGPAPVTGNVTVSLASSTPAAGTIVAGQAIASLATFNVTNGTSSEVKVTSFKAKRLGVSADTTPSKVYLYDGMSRLTDDASVSSGYISWNNAAGLFTIPANSTRLVTVKSNIATGTSGETLGVGVQAASDVTVSAGTVGGTFPVNGNLMTIASSTLADVNFNATTTPAATSVDPQDGYVAWQNTVNIGTRAVNLSSMNFRVIGSVYATDLKNFKLFIDGVQVGSTVSQMDANGYVLFDFAAKKYETGNRIVKVMVDIVSGSSRNFYVSLRQAADVYATDADYGAVVLARADSATFTSRNAGQQDINAGSLTFTKRTDSPSGNVVDGASNVVLAKYDVKAYGENMKVETLRVRIDEDDDHTAFTLRNGALFLDGAQVGSTAAIAGDTDSTQAYTEFSLGSSFIVEPGVTRVLEVKADLYDSDGTDEVVDADTIQVELGAGTSNVQKMTSLGYGTYPASYTEANTLTVSTGSLSVAKNTSYSNHTIVAPKTAYKLGSYNAQVATTENVTVTSVVVDWDTITDAFAPASDLNNVYITIGTGYTSPIKSTVATTGNTFSTNVTLTAGDTYAINVYGDVLAGATDGAGAADTGISGITVSYNTVASGTSTTATQVDGQTITFGAGTFTTGLDQSSALNRIVSGNQTVEAARFKVTSTNETYFVKEVRFTVASATVASAINSVELWEVGGTSAVGSGSLVLSTNTATLITGLNVQVAPGADKILIAKYVLNNIGSGAGTSQVNAQLTMDSVKYADSQGVELTEGTDRTGNQVYVYKTIPTVAQVVLPTAKIVNGSPMDIFKFTVTASTQGDLALKQFKFPVSWNDVTGTGTDTLLLDSMKLYEDGSDITDRVVIQDQGGTSAEATGNFGEADTTIVVSWATTYEGTISAGTSKTYTLKATPQGWNVNGLLSTPTDSFTVYMVGDAAHNSTNLFLNGTVTAATLWGLHTSAVATGSGTAYNFIWSDKSASPHSTAENATSSGDWANGYKVLNLDLPTQTWSMN